MRYARAMVPRSRRAVPRLSFCLAAILALGACASSHRVAPATSFLWEISGKKGRPTSYIMGSIHMGKKGFYPLPEAVQRAFRRSQVIVLEARPDQGMAAMGAVMRSGMYAPPDGLQKHISKKAWALVKKKLAQNALVLAAVGQMKPWLAAITISALDLKAAGFDPKLGVEMHLLGKRGKRRVDFLEGLQKQMQFFSSFSDKLQEDFLVYTIEKGKEVNKMMPIMVRHWKRGDTRGLERLMRKAASDKRFKPIEKVLLDDRNKSMSKTIEGMLTKSKEVHFIVVGAGHLVGKKSILSELAKRGYKLRQL